MLDSFLKVAIHASKTSGKILVEYFEKLNDTYQKTENIRDLVTEVDKLSEKNIKGEIKKVFPSHSIIGEELGEKMMESDYCWYIDPIDGTVNYSQGIPFCAISIGLEYRKQMIVGVVFNPFTKELFYTSKENGSFLNGKRIQVSVKESLETGLYIAAFSSQTTKTRGQEYKIFGEINDSTLGVLRTGSAALSMAYLACGRIDGFWAKDLHSWDVAAGILLVQEAGGEVSDTRGRPYKFQTELIASNCRLHGHLLKKLRNL